MSEEAMLASLRASFPEFSWRLGDSEYEGLHIHGTNEDQVEFEIWYEDKPPGGYISFRSAWKDVANREEKKAVMYESFQQRLSPAFDIINAQGVEHEKPHKLTK